MNNYDYKTLPVNGTQVIDPNKTGMSFYDQFLDDKETHYLHNNKNLRGDVVMMSPQKYYELCSKHGFGHEVPVDKLKQSRAAAQKNIEHLKNVLTVQKKRFPMPMLNLAEHSQEGLHRMMAIGELYGWDLKVPVLVVDWYDKDRAKRDAEAKKKYELDWNVEKAITRACRYTYYSVDELASQLGSELYDQFKFSDDVKVPDHIDVEETRGGYKFTFAGYDYVIDKDDVRMEESNDELDDIDDQDIDYEEFLRRYFGDNWRETHPHLKKTFGID